MPEELTRRALALARGERGEWAPPPVRDAATVALVRDGVAGLEVFVLRRQRSMAFAAGMHVFPGGALEPGDIDPGVPLALGRGFDADLEAERVACEAPEVARGLLVAAVRETFEECGVLVAVGPDGRAPARDERDPRAVVAWEADRVDVLGGRRSLAEVLSSRGVSIDPALVPLWGHWITPAVEERRFDTRFYVAALPPGQQAHDVGGEADRVHWVRPRDALAAYRAGTMAMLPPTVATLAELADLPDAAAVLAAAAGKRPPALMPEPYLAPDGGVAWQLVDCRDGSVVMAGLGEPAGSEARGVTVGDESSRGSR